MKNLKHLLTLSAFLSASLLSSLSLAELRETSSMVEATASADLKTLVVFDLDNTVIEATQTLGSDQFFGFLVDQAKKQGLDGQAAVDWALERASLVQPTSKVRAVESVTPDLIRSLQDRGITVIGLTARSISWADATTHQLRSIGVDFTRSGALPHDDTVGPDHSGRYVQGVLYMKNGGDKGEFLVHLLHQAGSSQNRILFIDDKLRNVESVEAALGKTPLEHLSFRYGAADPQVKAFDSKLAQFEWEYFLSFGVFLSDQRARELIQETTPVAM